MLQNQQSDFSPGCIFDCSVNLNNFSRFKNISCQSTLRQNIFTVHFWCFLWQLVQDENSVIKSRKKLLPHCCLKINLVNLAVRFTEILMVYSNKQNKRNRQAMDDVDFFFFTFNIAGKFVTFIFQIFLWYFLMALSPHKLTLRFFLLSVFHIQQQFISTKTTPIVYISELFPPFFICLSCLRPNFHWQMYEKWLGQHE